MIQVRQWRRKRKARLARASKSPVQGKGAGDQVRPLPSALTALSSSDCFVFRRVPELGPCREEFRAPFLYRRVGQFDQRLVKGVMRRFEGIVVPGVVTADE